jgi:hypothetical protein
MERGGFRFWGAVEILTIAFFWISGKVRCVRVRRGILLVLSFVGLVAVILVVAWPREPQYNGKRLSEWVNMYRDAVQPIDLDSVTVDKAKQEEAVAAVRQMRDEILPRAVRSVG